MAEIQHSIKVAARRTGLSPHVIRVWERRYDAVSPNRTDTNRRRFSEAEIERLSLLRAATMAGHAIGDVARLPVEKLRELAQNVEAAPRTAPQTDGSTGNLISAAITAVSQSNAIELHELLGRGAVTLGPHGLLEKIISPLANRIGELWRDGSITAAQEHFASSVIRDFLTRNSKPYALNGNAPTIVVGTPAGQLHELGAVMAAAAANDMGWRVVYLGTSLPAVEIAGAALRHQARAVALSIVFPGDDPNLPQELEHLRKHLPETTAIIVGGRAAESYAATLKKITARSTDNLKVFYEVLAEMRMPG